MINIIEQLLDWIYRKNCYLCRKTISSDLICKKCFDEIEIISSNPVKEIKGVKVYSTSLYINNIRKLIKALKYQGKSELAKPLAKILYTFWENSGLNAEEFDIVPMPLYFLRKVKRGYNHVELLAEEFSKLTGYSVNKRIAKRIKNTRPQYKLSKLERAENLREAFEINPAHYRNKKLLLLDDICTTGATLEELITAFKKAGINDLCALTCGYTQKLSLR